MAPAAEGLPALSDGLRLLSKLAVVGDMGTATRQTARGCAGSPWPQSGAERWNYRQSDGEDDRKRGIRGYDGGKRTLGRKRHIVVDVLGLLLIVVVHSAGIQDRNGAKYVLTRLISSFPGLRLVWADGGYAGKLVNWVAVVLHRTLSIVKRPRPRSVLALFLRKKGKARTLRLRLKVENSHRSTIVLVTKPKTPVEDPYASLRISLQKVC